MTEGPRHSLLIGLALGIAVSLLQACAPRPPTLPNLPDDTAVIAQQVVYKIPPPSALPGPVQIDQMIVARYRGRSFSFEAQIEITPQALDLVAVDGLGRRAMTIRWDGHDVRYDPAPWLPPMFRPSDILASMTMVYWPEESVRAALTEAKASLAASTTRRTISVKGKPVVVVDYESGEGWNRSAHIRNLAFGYGLDIQSVELPN